MTERRSIHFISITKGQQKKIRSSELLHLTGGTSFEPEALSVVVV